MIQYALAWPYLLSELERIQGQDAYVDGALDPGLLQRLAAGRLVHVLVVLPPALPVPEEEEGDAIPSS